MAGGAVAGAVCAVWAAVTVRRIRIRDAVVHALARCVVNGEWYLALCARGTIWWLAYLAVLCFAHNALSIVVEVTWHAILADSVCHTLIAERHWAMNLELTLCQSTCLIAIAATRL